MSRLRRIRKGLASLELTLACLGLLMILVVLCTLAQVRLGTFRAVEVYIRSVFLWWGPPGSPIRVPVFPGGGLVGLVLLANLVAAQWSRLEPSWRKAGLWAVHLGLILLFVGEFTTGFFQAEAHIAIEEGATRDYAESPREAELAVTDVSAKDHDEVFAVPQAVLARRQAIQREPLPFTLLVKRFYANSVLEPRLPGETGLPSMATVGAGPRYVVFERPPVSRDDEADQVSAFVEIVDGDRSLGTWLLSTALPEEQGFSHRGRAYALALRPRRRYLPFSLTLKDFRHEQYPGTDIPRHFSSLVRLRDSRGGEDRDVLISMNRPLRYGGKAFYQSGFGKDDTLSIIQVVENPGWLLPYLACALVGLGLGVHFVIRLRPTWRAS